MARTAGHHQQRRRPPEPVPHGLPKPASAEDRLPLLRRHPRDPVGGEVGVLGLLQRRDEVGGQLVLGTGDLHGLDVVGRGDRIGRVDQAGVGLAGDDLVEGGADVLLEADRLGGDAVGVEHGEGDLAARHLVRASHPGGVGEVVERLDAGGVALRHHDREDVGREGLHLTGGARVLGQLHRGLVGGGQDVAGCAVGDLLGEVGARAEGEDDVGVVLLLERRGELVEDVGQRGGGEHGELAATSTATSAPTLRGLPVVATPAGGEGEQQDQDGEPLHLGTSTTTLVDFTLAMARTPGSRPSSSAASVLISDTTR